MPGKRSLVGALCSALFASHAIAQAGVTRSVAAFTPLEPTRQIAAERRYGSPWLIGGQLVGGALAAAGAGFLAWGAYENPNGTDRRVKGDEGYTPNANTAYAIGSYAGVVAATHLIGRLDGSRGNLLGTALGAAIPSLPLFFGRNEPYLPLIG